MKLRLLTGAAPKSCGDLIVELAGDNRQLRIADLRLRVLLRPEIFVEKPLGTLRGREACDRKFDSLLR